MQASNRPARSLLWSSGMHGPTRSRDRRLERKMHGGCLEDGQRHGLPTANCPQPACLSVHPWRRLVVMGHRAGRPANAAGR